MKKLAIATLVALAATTASALEMGVTASRDYSGTDRNGFGVFVGDRAGKGAIQFGVEQFTQGNNNQDRVTAIGSYDLTTVGPVTLSAKGGVAYLNNQTSADGFAALVGVGASVPVNKTFSVDLGVVRQYGQDRVSQFDGNVVTAGLRVKF
jgi:hypothetical protein